MQLDDLACACHSAAREHVLGHVREQSDPMTTMLEQLELMREKMRQMSESEMQLVRGLGEALNVADERLREQVRQFALEHNDRRSIALAELRALSARLGMLPKERFDNVRQSALPSDGCLLAPALHERRSKVASRHDVDLQASGPVRAG